MPHVSSEEKECERPTLTEGDGLGSGSFGNVFLGLNSDTGELFAVKEVTAGRSVHVLVLMFRAHNRGLN